MTVQQGKRKNRVTAVKPHQRRHFRDELRLARAAALADAEGIVQPLHTLERLGRFLDPRVKTLGRAAGVLTELASESFLAADLPREWPVFHRPFPALLDSVRDARNDVMHVGARARHLTSHAVEVCSILEDALQAPLDRVADFMVSEMVAVEGWQPVSLLRRIMLEHSFTSIPIRPDEDDPRWLIVSDSQLARFVGLRSGRLDRLAKPLRDVLGKGLEYSEAEFVDGDQPVETVRSELGTLPVLVKDEERVVGLITAFDLL